MTKLFWVIFLPVVSISSFADPLQLAPAWVKTDDGTPHVVRADIKIKAPIEDVWKIIANPSGYGSFNGNLVAQTNSVTPGSSIHLGITLGAGSINLTYSNEIIEVVDSTHYAIAWKRNFGFGLFSHRWQILEQDGDFVHYYTAVEVPGLIGQIVDHCQAPGIERAFIAFAQALKNKMECL